MTATRAKYQAMSRAAIADAVARAWGAHAPFPEPRIRAKYRQWRVYADEAARLHRSLADAPRREHARIHRAMAAAMAKRDRIRPPRRYRSWAHVGAFLDRESTWRLILSFAGGA
jgi:hypothetical protein